MSDCLSAARKDALIARLKAEGFDVVRVTAPDQIPKAPSRLRAFLENGRHGTMDWLAAREDRRGDPQALWPDVKSIVMVGHNYGPDHDPLESLQQKDRGVISIYALGADYHDVMKKTLKRVGRRFAEETGEDVKIFVDTAPVMEKPLAEAAGIGWQGKHTNLVSRDLGSWLFLGALFTTAALPPDASETDHCGSCRACLDICPTNAFPAPYQLDARRCISYLTIEHKGPIPEEFREAIGNRIYGCDDCLAVCPWNKFAERASEAKYYARDETRLPPLAELAALDDARFRERFRGSPIKRIGRDRFVRNVLVAIGNSGDPSLRPAAEALCTDPSYIVRDAAMWAMGRFENAGKRTGAMV
ncbi:MAG: tRNA epoxyqueuosine(34) reductase QueG [Hyphomicrobiales bacterium]|nr:tRNA epoxyqueuosine(34) reductase QueG [Hyphomicrobiales bacterium]